jgi:hypothetical protein
MKDTIETKLVEDDEAVMKVVDSTFELNDLRGTLLR